MSTSAPRAASLAAAALAGPLAEPELDEDTDTDLDAADTDPDAADADPDAADADPDAADADPDAADADPDAADADAGPGGEETSASVAAERRAFAAAAAAAASAGAAVDWGLTSHLEPDGRPRIVERRFVVEEAFAGHRLDHYLKRMIPRLSRTKLQAIIKSQLVRPDGRPFKASSSVATGEVFVIRRPARAEPPCPRTFGVLHEDGDVVVIDKPAGLPVHASAKFYFNTLTRVLAERYPTERLQICHRLDRETSGALVCARSRAAAAVLKGAFQDKKVTKSYLAIVHGQPPWPDAGPDGGPAAGSEDAALDYPLALVAQSRERVNVRMEVRADGLPSLTRVRVVERRGRYALVHCFPVTGRQHQIRAHLAAAGFPIVGDKLYAHGDEAFAAYCAQGMTPELLARFELPRHALHAASIRLPHPQGGSYFQVDSPLAPDLADFLCRAPAAV